MARARATPIRHPLLQSCGVAHGFGLRGDPAPLGLLRPRQVHGAVVAELGSGSVLEPVDADAVVSAHRGSVVGVVTADCVPILAAGRGGRAVAAIHAGWRGLALGVVEAGVETLRARVAGGEEIFAVIGPHIGPCCYEVDTPVLEVLERRFGSDLASALQPSRPLHSRLDLAALVRCDLARLGLAEPRVAVLGGACTCCDPLRFESHRRDGASAGRLVHHIAVAGTSVVFPGG